jgi:lipopolysaccharide export system protein LptA
MHCSLLIVHCSLYSQTPGTRRIELVQANSFEFDKKLGDKVRRLKGEVIFKHENYYLYCDSAYLNNEQNSLDAFGKIRIRSGDTLNIYGDLLKYDGNKEIARISGNVKMVDKQMTLTTNFLTYSLRTDIANYTDGGTLIDPENTLKSKIGYYYTNSKKFFFRDNVVLTNPHYTMTSDTLMYNTVTATSYFYGPTYIVSKKNTIFCEYGNYNTKTDVSQFSKKVYVLDSTQQINADSIYYNRRSGESMAFNNITIVNADHSTVIRGDRAYYNDIRGFLLITRRAQLIMIDKQDSLFLHSDTLKAVATDTSKKNRIFYAFHKVKFFRHDLQGLCDTLIYDTKDSLIYLRNNPILWSEKNQMTAKKVEMKLKNRKIQKISFYNSSFISSEYDTSRFNQIKGKDIIAWFSNNELEHLDVKTNAETIYYFKDEKGKLVGINSSTSPDMKIYITDNKVRKVLHLDQTEGTFYPEKDFKKEESFLKDFRWYKDIRPKDKLDIFK